MSVGRQPLWSAASEAAVASPAEKPGARPARPAATPARRRSRARRPRPAVVDGAAALAGLGLGVTIALAVSAESWRGLSAAGGWLTFGGRLAGLVAAYAMLLVVLLAGRLPPIERAIGQDRLVRWHRKLAPWSLVLITVHGTLITLGYAAGARTGVLHQYWQLLRTYPGILTASVAYVLLIAAGVTSWRIARRRMKYETWWAVHLYTYLALALSFSHQIATGASFVGHPVTRIWWTALWIGTAGAVLAFRILLPLWRSIVHDLRVVAVEPIAPGVVNVVCRGRRLERLPLSGGQFLQWRLLKRGLWWQAHPYSVSAPAAPPFLRFTVKDLGDHSAALAAITPGTRVAIEGPYGAFTADRARRRKVALIGAGVGITPLRALLQELPRSTDVVVINRAHTAQDLVLADELRRMTGRRGGRLHELVGPRDQVPLDAPALTRLIPDLTGRDVFVCGPDGFTDGICESARRLGVPGEQIHTETFSL